MKCPKCNMSDKVHSINIGRRLLGSILYAGAGIQTAGRGVSVMRDAYKSVCPTRKYYCERCKMEFEKPAL